MKQERYKLIAIDNITKDEYVIDYLFNNAACGRFGSPQENYLKK